MEFRWAIVAFDLMTVQTMCGMLYSLYELYTESVWNCCRLCTDVVKNSVDCVRKGVALHGFESLFRAESRRHEVST